MLYKLTMKISKFKPSEQRSKKKYVRQSVMIMLGKICLTKFYKSNVQVIKLPKNSNYLQVRLKKIRQYFANAMPMTKLKSKIK